MMTLWIQKKKKRHRCTNNTRITDNQSADIIIVVERYSTTPEELNDTEKFGLNAK